MSDLANFEITWFRGRGWLFYSFKAPPAFITARSNVLIGLERLHKHHLLSTVDFSDKTSAQIRVYAHAGSRVMLHLGGCRLDGTFASYHLTEPFRTVPHENLAAIIVRTLTDFTPSRSSGCLLWRSPCLLDFQQPSLAAICLEYAYFVARTLSVPQRYIMCKYRPWFSTKPRNPLSPLSSSMLSAALVSLSLAAAALAQQVGTNTAETHPTLPWQECTKSGGCVTKSAGAITIDANWRWVHQTTGYTNCYTGNKWDTSICSTNADCATKCAVDGASYASTYGITTSGDALTLKFVTKGENTNIGSRVYLMESDTKYQMFNLLNKEFTFDVDVSQLPCGLNGALYFVQMDADGGMSKQPNNKAGAKYGTGYCDSQCPRDLKFISGEANVEGWTGSATDPNAGTGNAGSCCGEMDIWEANSISTAYTPHPCKTVNDGGQQRCTGQECNTPDRYGGLCDPDGCDFNSFRMGDKSFYGPGLTVDTKKKLTVVTQFITDNNSTTGTLVEIRRVYVQDGKVIPNSKVNFPGLLDNFDSITEKFCDDQKTAFGDTKSFQNQGGLAGMGKSLAHGHVLVLSVWADHGANMLWLDSDYPTDASPSTPGISRGTCATSSGKPADVIANSPNAQVVFSNIKFGDIGTTFTGGSSGNPGTTTTTTSTTSTTTTRTSTTSTTTSSAPSATQTQWGQCGGIGYSGPTACASGLKCNVINEYYSQCIA